MGERRESSEPSIVSKKGRVVEFDEHRGLGLVEGESGDRYVFHCVELTDGSRRIDTGADVEFEVRQKFSRPEAFTIRRI